MNDVIINIWIEMLEIIGVSLALNIVINSKNVVFSPYFLVI